MPFELENLVRLATDTYVFAVKIKKKRGQPNKTCFLETLKSEGTLKKTLAEMVSLCFELI